MKPVQNFIVGVRHGGDTRYTTETLLIGAKTPEEAIGIAKAGYVKHYHYTCNRAEKDPNLTLKQGEIHFWHKRDTKGDRLSYHPMRQRQSRRLF